MKKTTIIIATIFVLTLVATCLAGCGLVYAGDFHITNHTVAEFNSINIDTDITDIEIKVDNNAEYGVVCYETDKIAHIVRVDNNTLYISSKAPNLNLIGVTKTPKVTVYLKESQYNNLYIDTDTGKISVAKNISFDMVELSSDTGSIEYNATVTNKIKAETDTGKIKIDGIGNCNSVKLDSDTGAISTSNFVTKSLNIDLDTGKTTISNVKADEVSVSSSTGDVELDRLESLNILIITDTGDVRGTVVGPMNFVVTSDTGSTSVPENEVGGLCKISTNTGDVRITRYVE